MTHLVVQEAQDNTADAGAKSEDQVAPDLGSGESQDSGVV